MNRKPHAKLFTTASVLGGALFAAAPAAAATITAGTDANARYTIAWGSADEIGDAVATSTSLPVGDGDTNPTLGQPEYRPVIQFDISGAANTTDIAAATTVEFAIEVNRFVGTPQGFELYAITDVSAEDGVVSASDYQAAGTLVGSWAAGSLTAGETITADVTSFVKADSLAGHGWSAFRFQVIDPSTAPDGDGNFDITHFTPGSATLTTTAVPEPASLTALAVSAACILGRRRRALV